MIRKLTYILGTAMLLLVSGAVSSSGWTQDAAVRGDLIRVAVLKDAAEIYVSVRGQYSIIDPESGLEIIRGRKLRRTRIRSTPNGIRIGSAEYKINKIGIRAQKDITIYISGKRRKYRDRLDIAKTPENKLLAINLLQLESYIRGVLYHEVTDRWPLEAIKAQAVAARTYALYRMKTSAEELFDVTSDIYSQVYGGKSAEKYRTNLAVKRTSGLILLHNDEVLPAYFHANSGGHTEDVRQLWKYDYIRPLKGIKDDFSHSLPSYTWKKNFRSKDVEDKLRKGGYNVGSIQNIEILGRNESGRITKLRITSRNGKTTLISGKDFRHIVGPNDIRSNNYKIEMKGYYFDAVGKGWGHGVGLSQWGAYGMAKMRYKYDEILKYYYPTVDIVDYRSLDFADLMYVPPIEKPKS